MAGGGEAQAACRCQPDLGHDADDEREAFRSQALLQDPERIGGARGLHDEAGRRCKAEGSKPPAMRQPELAGESRGAAPEHLGRSRRAQGLKAAHREPHGKAQGCRPVAESASPGVGLLRLDLMQGSRLQPAGEAAVELGGAE